MVIAEYLLCLDGKEREVEVLGSCRARDGRVECEVEKVMLDGRDRFGDVPEAHMQFMRQRLWHAYLADRHPYGEPEAAV